MMVLNSCAAAAFATGQTRNGLLIDLTPNQGASVHVVSKTSLDFPFALEMTTMTLSCSMIDNSAP